MSKRFEIVPFHQHQIMTVKTDSHVLVVMKPITESLGLTWRTQHERITKHPVISKGVRFTLIPSAGGMQEMLALDLEQFHGWLITLDPRRVKDDGKRELIIRYQNEAFRVIFEHFHGKIGGAAQPKILPPVRDIIGLLDAIKNERTPATRSLLYDLLDQRCRASNVATPTLDSLVAANPESQIADAFFAALLELQNRGVDFNQHRNPALLGVSLPALRPLMEREHIEYPPDRLLWQALRLHPAYDHHGNANCRDGKIRQCWVFRRVDLLGFEPYPTASNRSV